MPFIVVCLFCENLLTYSCFGFFLVLGQFYLSLLVLVYEELIHCVLAFVMSCLSQLFWNSLESSRSDGR